jgi:hypothetical protein
VKRANKCSLSRFGQIQRGFNAAYREATAWLDTNVLVKIERRERPDLELELLKMEQDGRALLIPPVRRDRIL